MINKTEQAAKTYIVPAVEQSIHVMFCLADGGSTPKSLTDICREVGIHRSKAFAILNTLNKYNLVRKNPNRKGYALGAGLLTLTGKLFESLDFPRMVESVLSDLAKKVKATVTLGVILDDKTCVVAEYEGAPGIGISSPIGSLTPITYGAHGKAIAAFLPPTELDALLKTENLLFYGSPEKCDRARLAIELEECRRKGFALELGDVQKGVNAVAAPVLDRNNNPTGYLTIVGFFSEEQAHDLGPLAIEAVKAISSETGQMLFWQKSGRRSFLQ